MAKPFRRSRGREKEKSEFDQRVIDVARVARVMAGGRRFSFRATVAIGDRKRRVAIGIAKANDVSRAINKAVVQAKKDITEVKIKETTIPHEVYSKFGAARVFLKPAQKGRGIVAGGVVRVICDLAGISDIVSKVVSRSTNKLNNAIATIEALKKLK
ncbi:MAG: 30S ribosomal protein S5 [Candidatus Portnoybacteria bacterium]|nr:30S ribosomal protein S5 [Candidatus Portnoybacteria bacterium]